MARLVLEMRSEAFSTAHPVLQAAYAHYGLVAIHPFADGNGRVARALASAFTYRKISMPIVILSEHKNTYWDALESADNGDYQVFVEFMLARSLDTIKLVDESVRSALAPSADMSLAEINSLYITKGGYTHDQVDHAGLQLLNAVKTAIERASSNAAPRVTRSIAVQHATYAVPDSGYRRPMNDMGYLHVAFFSSPPAQAQVSRQYFLWLPKDAAGDDDILLKNANVAVDFVARMDEVVPAVSGVLQIRLNLFGERVVCVMLNDLKDLAQKSFRAPH